MTTDELGNPRYISEPAYLDSAGAMPINVEKILADQGAVLLDIPGLDTNTPEMLVLDVTRKPMILLVWIGTTIVLLGCVVSFARRRKDLS
jgi:cytochrome c biogenesis factor